MAFLRGIPWVVPRRRVSRYPRSDVSVKERAGSRPQGTEATMAKATGKAARDGYPRDLVGYGATLPDPRRPGRARPALQLSLNYQGAGDLSVLHADGRSDRLPPDP